MTVVDPKWFSLKNKLVIYTKAFVELYNWKNREQIHKTQKIIELEKIYTLTAENLYYLCTYQILEISSILYNIYVTPEDQDKFMFYINNYID